MLLSSYLLLAQMAANVPVATPRVGAKSATISRVGLLKNGVLRGFRAGQECTVPAVSVAADDREFEKGRETENHKNHQLARYKT